MVQRKFYLPEEMYNKLQLRAKVMGTTTTDVLRELVEKGLKGKEKEATGKGVKGLLELAWMAEKNRWKGPHDLAGKHDEYFTKAK